MIGDSFDCLNCNEEIYEDKNERLIHVVTKNEWCYDLYSGVHAKRKYTFLEKLEML